MRTPLLLALATLSLAAQDRFHIGLDLASQAGRSQSFLGGTLESKQRTQFGLEAGWKAFARDRMDLRITAGLRFKADADVESSYLGMTRHIGSLEHQSLAVGAEVTWYLPFELGGGLQLRQERMNMVFPETGGPNLTATSTRPWLTAHAGWSGKAQGLRPFLRGRMALPLTHTNVTEPSDPDGDVSDTEVVKSLAPRFELSFQVGLRF